MPNAKPAKRTKVDYMTMFVDTVAAMTAEGEDLDGEEFSWTNDDAFDTLQSLIHQARALKEIPWEHVTVADWGLTSTIFGSDGEVAIMLDGIDIVHVVPQGPVGDIGAKVHVSVYEPGETAVVEVQVPRLDDQPTHVEAKAIDEYGFDPDRPVVDQGTVLNVPPLKEVDDA